jgi:alkylhydroperoxidase/carboxymuconolactone decarboxylase family protein YurZ
MEHGLDPFFALDPVSTDEFMAMGGAIYKSGIMTPREVELLSIALDASVTHMYAPGTRRHIKNALQAGATVDEVMEILKLCVTFGVQTFNMSLRVLAEELQHH